MDAIFARRVGEEKDRYLFGRLAMADVVKTIAIAMDTRTAYSRYQSVARRRGKLNRGIRNLAHQRSLLRTAVDRRVIDRL